MDEELQLLINRLTNNQHICSLIEEILTKEVPTYEVRFSSIGKLYSLTLVYKEAVHTREQTFLFDVHVVFYYNKEINVIVIQIFDGKDEVSTVNYLKFSINSIPKTVRQTLASMFIREVKIGKQKLDGLTRRSVVNER